MGGKFVHHGKVVAGTVKQGETATFKVNSVVRLDSARNHSATHLLQKALREVVGGHVEQAGSNVTKDRLRFDYTHFEALSAEQIERVEAIVNEKILSALDITTMETSIDEARKMGAMALFGEKYGEVVRVVDMGHYSVELCGGTHLINTAQIGTFKIVSESGVASGVRRIEAVTGRGAIHYYQEIEKELNEVAKLVKAKKDGITKKVEHLMAESKELQKENDKLKAEMAKAEAENIFDQVQEIAGLKVLVAALPNMDMNALRNMGDTFKDKLGEGVVVLASSQDEKVSLVAMATNDAVSAGIHCGNIIKASAPVVQGGGGGRPNMAQAGGKDASKMNEALQTATDIIKEQLKK